MEHRCLGAKGACRRCCRGPEFLCCTSAAQWSQYTSVPFGTARRLHVGPSSRFKTRGHAGWWLGAGWRSQGKQGWIWRHGFSSGCRLWRPKPAWAERTALVQLRGNAGHASAVLAEARQNGPAPETGAGPLRSEGEAGFPVR